MAPVQICVRDDLSGRRSTPAGHVFGGVSVGDQESVIASNKGAVQGRANASVRLRADDDEATDAELLQESAQVGVLEGVAVTLVHNRLARGGRQFRDDQPAFASSRKTIIMVTNPDHWDLARSSAIYKVADVRNHGVPVDHQAWS